MKTRHPGSGIFAWLMALAASDSVPGQAGSRPGGALRSEVVRGHAQRCHELYRGCEARGKDLQAAVAALLARPDAATLRAARAAWVAGRRIYGQTEFARFYGGPIDALDPFLNAWPVDEAYIDAVILADEAAHPQLSETALLLANERGGEANVSTGWHAIEFLLWGQDLRKDGPGDRPATDLAPGSRATARRREYLHNVTNLLVRQLGLLRSAWAPDADNYRRGFEADPEAALRRILTGALVMTTFELQGERLAVALETQDQEQEHSCFSDTTHVDLEANQLGIQTVFTGGGDPRCGPGLLALVRERSAPVADDLARRLETTLQRLRAIPAPFDQAMLGGDDAPGRKAIRAAIAALEAQSDALAIVGRLFGFDLPVKPPGG